MCVSKQTVDERGPDAEANKHDHSALRPLRLDERCSGFYEATLNRVAGQLDPIAHS